MYSDEMDMYDVATQNVFYFTQYIKSRKNIVLKKSKKKQENIQLLNFTCQFLNEIN